MIVLPVASRRAMTLIELIVVMAVIATVVAVTSPSLSRFFGGQSLESEARRMLGVMRYAQSQAVSLSVPIEMWMSASEAIYGLETKSGYGDADMEEMEYQLGEELRFDEGEMDVGEDEQVIATFFPDGTLEGETIVLRNRDEEQIVLSQSEVGSGYMIEENLEER